LKGLSVECPNASFLSIDESCVKDESKEVSRVCDANGYRCPGDAHLELDYQYVAPEHVEDCTKKLSHHGNVRFSIGTQIAKDTVELGLNEETWNLSDDINSRIF
jgi:hypothetical protein